MILVPFHPLVLAQAFGQSGSMLMYVVALMAVMYFVMIMPQQRQLKQHKQLLAGLKKGDEVVTQGGMMGKIHAVNEKTVVLEVANGVRVQVLKTSVQGKATAEAPTASTSAKADDETKEKK